MADELTVDQPYRLVAAWASRRLWREVFRADMDGELWGGVHKSKVQMLFHELDGGL